MPGFRQDDLRAACFSRTIYLCFVVGSERLSGLVYTSLPESNRLLVQCMKSLKSAN